MSKIVDEIRAACARVVDQARYVSINLEAIPAYAASLVTGATEPPPDPIAHLLAGDQGLRAARGRADRCERSANVPSGARSAALATRW